VRRTSGAQNVTTRETKRLKEREKDKEYRRLTLNRADLHSFQSADRDEGQAQSVGRNGGSVTNEHGARFSPAHSVPSPFRQPDAAAILPVSPGRMGSWISHQVDSVFEIALVNEGRTHKHRVFEGLRVSQLAVEADGILSLAPDGVVLMLFSTAPIMLYRTQTLAGPPRVNPNATVFVFVVMGIPEARSPIPGAQSPYTAKGGGAFRVAHGGCASNALQIVGNFQTPQIRWYV
jgi:hypothetical protein